MSLTYNTTIAQDTVLAEIAAKVGKTPQAVFDEACGAAFANWRRERGNDKLAEVSAVWPEATGSERQAAMTALAPAVQRLKGAVETQSALFSQPVSL